MKMYKFLIMSFAAIIVFASCNNNKPAENAASEVTAVKASEEKIVYILIDSLLANYDLYKDNKNELEEQYQKSEKALAGKIEAFQRRVGAFQQEVMAIEQKANTIAPVELQKLQEKFSKQQQNLAKEEEALMKQRDNAAMDLEKKLVEMQADLQIKIDEYLEKVAEEKGYDFVLMKGSGGGVMYGRSTLDITEATLEVLNKEYAERKK